jgi:hypothetical protein
MGKDLDSPLIGTVSGENQKSMTHSIHHPVFAVPADVAVCQDARALAPGVRDMNAIGLDGVDAPLAIDVG